MNLKNFGFSVYYGFRSSLLRGRMNPDLWVSEILVFVSSLVVLTDLDLQLGSSVKYIHIYISIYIRIYALFEQINCHCCYSAPHLNASERDLSKG